MAVVPVVMPRLGESVVEATLSRWLVKPGDSVQADQTIAEASTDKADTELPSPAAGKITKLLVSEGQTVAIGTPIAEIDTAAVAQHYVSAEGSPGAVARPPPHRAAEEDRGGAGEGAGSSLRPRHYPPAAERQAGAVRCGTGAQACRRRARPRPLPPTASGRQAHLPARPADGWRVRRRPLAGARHRRGGPRHQARICWPGCRRGRRRGPRRSRRRRRRQAPPARRLRRRGPRSPRPRVYRPPEYRPLPGDRWW
jgi:2-oxoglutarate dehydrogenase E2 component (dihydrolipoamide succinyltransferase)